MKKIFLAGVMMGFCCRAVFAQDIRADYQRQFEAYRNQQTQAFDAYRQQQQEMFRAYEESMRRQWEEFMVSAKMSMSLRPEPPQQPVRPSGVATENRLMPVAEVMGTVSALNRKAGGNLDEDIPEDYFSDLEDFLEDDSEPVPEPEPAPATLMVEGGNPSAFQFTYLGSPCRVHMGKDFAFTLNGVDENCCADAWKKLSMADVKALSDDCKALRKAMRLGDWGYVGLLNAMGDAYYGNGNKSTLFTFMMLVYDGYRVKMCRMGNRLSLMAGTKETVYGYSYVTIDGLRHYILKDNENAQCYVVDMPREGTRLFSSKLSSVPALAYEGVPHREIRIQDKDGRAFSAKVKPNRNLIRYYNSLPRTNLWNYYVHASLSREVKRALYPLLRREISGKGEVEAVNFLLDFIQHGFQYKTDGEQFGYERPLFGDETFFYPYNDCEDRAILLSILSADLLGLESVLVEYDDHLSTAIRFNDEVSGSYFELDDGKYFCCDPTYIGAGVGESMPDYADKSAKIIRL
ncbi:MAG: hypothetical protein NC324_10610 [Bacteroides sp.]|nr:hypothetical protein [Bacteroides sp.]